MFGELLTWIEQLAVVRTIAASPVLYPLLNGAHILAFATLVGSIVTFDVAMLRNCQNRSVAEATLPIARTALLASTLTGLVLLAPRASYYVSNPAMQIKGALLITALCNVVLFHTLRSPTVRRITAAISLGLWPLILFAGRWVGFT